MNWRRRHPNLIYAGIALGLVAINVWLRWSATRNPGFHNEDVAGIAYSAQLLHAGGLPLIDTLELKAPGSFFLTAMIWKLGPQTIETMQTAGVLWSSLALLGIFWGGLQLSGLSAAFLSSLLYLFLAPIMDSIDVNYGSWMIAPFIWSFVCFLRYRLTSQKRWLLLTGVLLAVSGLMKRQGAALTPLYLVSLLTMAYGAQLNWKSRIKDCGQRWTWLLGGIGLGFAPIFLFYLTQGHLIEFAHHYFFSPGGWQYLDTLTTSQKLVRCQDGLAGFLEYGATASVLAILSFFGWAMTETRRSKDSTNEQRMAQNGTWFLLLGLLGVSIIGLTLGFRFFKGYYLQTLPALVWMSAMPTGVLRLVQRQKLIGYVAFLVLAIGLCQSVIPKDYQALKSIRQQRRTPRDKSAQRIAAEIRKNTNQSDRIWVWGRAAWPIYVHANRLAATRYPKTLAVFTTNLTNTWKRGTKPTEFEPRSNWRSLITELKRDRPAYIVLAHNEGYHRFKALKALLKTDYRKAEKQVRGFSVYRIIDPKPKKRGKKG